MDIATVLSKYDLDLSTVLSADGLVKLASAYSELLDTLTSETETQVERERAIKDGMLSEHRSLVNDASLDIREVIAGMIERHGDDILPALVEEVQAIKSDLIVLRDFHVSHVARTTKPEKAKGDDEIEARKSEASILREAIVSVHSLMGKPADVENFPTKKNAQNEIVPDLPRVPGGNTSGNVGKGAKIRQMLFEVNGERLPAGTLLYNMVEHYLCNFKDGIVTKTSDLKDAIDKSGQPFISEGYVNRWTVEIAGQIVSGWLPVEGESYDAN